MQYPNESPQDACRRLLQQGMALHKSNQLAEAKKIYEQILLIDPAHADGLHLLGLTALGLGNHKEAEKLIREAIAINNIFFYHSSLGNVLRMQNRIDDAVASFERALALKPDFPDALNNLALIFSKQKKINEAINLYKRALTADPNHVDTIVNLGLLLQEKGEIDSAIHLYNQALAIRPDTAEAHYNLGNALSEKGNKDAAIQAYMRAIAIRPYAEAHTNLATILNVRHLFYEAISHYKNALKFNPNSFDAYNNLGISYRSYGQLDESIKCFKKALEIKPDASLTYSNLLLAMVYASSVTPRELASTAAEYGTRYETPLLRTKAFANDKNPDRRLRIGYLSSDFYNHSVHYFFEFLPLLHDRKSFEIYAYANIEREDDVTRRMKKTFDHWRDIKKIDDDAVATLIESDKIDILIDMTGHTGENRLLVFARKPAPVQATWLGYPATTGLKSIDYRITDVYAEPKGLTENLNTETLWRLPEIFCCYQPGENSPDVINHPPFDDNGYITFGCFNNFAKVTDDVLETWAKIINRVKDSRLLLEIAGIEESNFRSDVENRLERAGFSSKQVILEPRKKENQFVLYNKIDIALDPYPCNGGTTSMDTLWMGVPFVTLAGEHFVSRMGVTILTNAGLPELIAGNCDEYIKVAVQLSQDRDRLRKMRHNLREKVAKSAIMNQEKFTRNMEVSYRGMWHQWLQDNQE